MPGPSYDPADDVPHFSDDRDPAVEARDEAQFVSWLATRAAPANPEHGAEPPVLDA
jgi:hypothetical protein